MRPPAVAFAAAVVVAATVALTGCSRGSGGLFPDPPSTDPVTTTTEPPDYSAVAVKAVTGRTTTTVPVIGPGQAHLGGSLDSPGGPVPNGVVRVEHLVGDQVASTDVVTLADGTWQLDNIVGGRYRVRAWRQPDLVTAAPMLFFLGGQEKRMLSLTLHQEQGTAVVSSIAPRPPPVDDPANLVVQVTTRSVDDQGIVRQAGVPGVTVDLAGSSAWLVQTTNPAVTDADGRVAWRVECREAGDSSLGVSVNGESFPLSLPGCADAPPPTTSPPATITSGTVAPPQTTTTRKRDNGNGKG